MTILDVCFIELRRSEEVPSWERRAQILSEDILLAVKQMISMIRTVTRAIDFAIRSGPGPCPLVGKETRETGQYGKSKRHLIVDLSALVALAKAPPAQDFRDITKRHAVYP